MEEIWSILVCSYMLGRYISRVYESDIFYNIFIPKFSILLGYISITILSHTTDMEQYGIIETKK